MKIIIRFAFAAMVMSVAVIVVYIWDSFHTTAVLQDVDTRSKSEEGIKKSGSAKSVKQNHSQRVKLQKDANSGDGTKERRELGADKKTGGGSLSEGAVVVERAKGSEKPSTADFDIAQPVLGELCAVFSMVSSGEPNADLAKALASYKPSVVLEAARSVMKNGSSKEKENALYAVGLLFGRESDTGVSFDITHPKSIAVGGGEEVATSSEATTGESELGTQLFSTVSAGLSDSDAGVRATAFDVMRALPDEDGSVLAATLLSGGDVDLQKRLMREAEGNASGIRLSLMGMGSECEEVRTLATENLESISGQKFADQKEAAEWYEAHQSEFPHNEGTGSATFGK